AAKALDMDNDQPTAIVYRTTKGWRYGVEGKASHGAGHKLCCSGFFDALKPFTDKTGVIMPSCHGADQPSGGQDSRCRTGADADVVEGCFWEALSAMRTVLEESRPLTNFLAGQLVSAKGRLERRKRKPREGAPSVDKVFATAKAKGARAPKDLTLEAGQKTTLRGELGRVLQYFNQQSGGAILAGSADLYGSTSIGTAGKGFAEGLFNGADNPDSRLLSTGGICEDAMTGILSGIATFGFHVGAGSSYGAFSAPLGHVPARLHAIGNQAKRALSEDPYSTIFIVCAHAGVKTGEDGPTHADPQALQLLEGNFPGGTMVTLTPWDPQEIWYLVAAALRQRPAVIAPFVTRPTETVLDRAGQGLATADAAAKGVYKLAAAANGSDGTVVLQGSEVANAFVETALPKLRAESIDVEAYYVASAELFDSLDEDERQAIF
ncbi:MAG: hypothetical protein MI741_12125, partial [Rhodospirillales bacterium]|nr:hypothetical protein [Rhodospirillales bacterium]